MNPRFFLPIMNVKRTRQIQRIFYQECAEFPRFHRNYRGMNLVINTGLHSRDERPSPGSLSDHISFEAARLKIQCAELEAASFCVSKIYPYSDHSFRGWFFQWIYSNPELGRIV